MQRLEVFNEFCELFLIYTMICFSDANLGLDYTVNYYDYMFLLGMGFNVLVHVFFMLKASVISTKDRIKDRCCKPKIAAKAPADGSPIVLKPIDAAGDIENDARAKYLDMAGKNALQTINEEVDDEQSQLESQQKEDQASSNLKKFSAVAQAKDNLSLGKVEAQSMAANQLI